MSYAQHKQETLKQKQEKLSNQIPTEASTFELYLIDEDDHNQLMYDLK